MWQWHNNSIIEGTKAIQKKSCSIQYVQKMIQNTQELPSQKNAKPRAIFIMKGIRGNQHDSFCKGTPMQIQTNVQVEWVIGKHKVVQGIYLSTVVFFDISVIQPAIFSRKNKDSCITKMSENTVHIFHQLVLPYHPLYTNSNAYKEIIYWRFGKHVNTDKNMEIIALKSGNSISNMHPWI